MKDYVVIFREGRTTVYESLKESHPEWFNGLTALYFLEDEDGMVVISITPFTWDHALKQIQEDLDS